MKDRKKSDAPQIQSGLIFLFKINTNVFAMKLRFAMSLADIAHYLTRMFGGAGPDNDN